MTRCNVVGTQNVHYNTKKDFTDKRTKQDFPNEGIH